jgi:hypothetical protein
MNLAIFDFCETIIKYQTADKFVDFLYNKSNTKSWFWGAVSKFLGNKFLAIFMGKFFPKLNFGKRAKLIKLKGINFNEFQTLSKLYAEEIQTAYTIYKLKVKKPVLSQRQLEPRVF